MTDLDRINGRDEGDALRLARRWAQSARRDPPASGDFLADDLDRIADEIERLRAENARLVEDRARFPDRPDDIGRMIQAHCENLKHGKESANDHARAAILRCSVALTDYRELIAATEFLSFYKDNPERPANKMTGARVTFGELRRVVVARSRLLNIHKGTEP